MEYYTIENCCDILNNKRIPVTQKDRNVGPYPYYGANGIQDSVDNYIFDDELVLIAEDGGHFGSKTKPIAYRVSGKCWVNNHAHVLKPKSFINVDYLCYSLMFYDVSSIVNGATRKKLNQKTMIKMKIPKRTIESQKLIADQLNTIKDIMDIKKKKLVSYDQLIKSRFVEMFGEPGLDNTKWETKELKDISNEKLSYGSGASAVDYNNSLRYIRITDITDSGELNDDFKSPSEIDSKYHLNDGDILFARTGATVGKTFLYKSEQHGEALYAGYLIKLVPNIKIVNPTFVFHYTKTNYYNNFILNTQKVAVQPNINAKQYGSLIINIPPIELQNEFEVFVKHIDKLKFAYFIVLNMI